MSIPQPPKVSFGFPHGQDQPSSGGLYFFRLGRHHHLSVEENPPEKTPPKMKRGKLFLLTVGAFLLTVKLLCLQSLKALIRRTFPLRVNKKLKL